MGGANNWEGRVEIFWNGDWGAISDSLWSTADANVVCRQLLHSPESGNYTIIILYSTHFSQIGKKYDFRRLRKGMREKRYNCKFCTTNFTTLCCAYLYIQINVILLVTLGVILVPSGAAIPCCSQYGAGVGDIHFSSVSCNGNENRITDCSYNTDEVADHQHDVRVQCQQGMFIKNGYIL